MEVQEQVEVQAQAEQKVHQVVLEQVEVVEHLEQKVHQVVLEQVEVVEHLGVQAQAEQVGLMGIQ